MTKEEGVASSVMIIIIIATKQLSPKTIINFILLFYYIKL